MITGKNILLGITGGIAAYKAADLASKLTAGGAIVKTVMTDHACEFIRPLTIKSLTGQPVITEYFTQDANIEHISLADWADILVIAPATANIIGKTAAGIADDLLSTTIMATRAPVLFVPAMNVHMYENPVVQANISRLKALNYFFAEPESGHLACGYEGKGRLPNTEEIIYHISTYLKYSLDLTGHNILVTAGATRQEIDPMRYLTNHSSGKMGFALARAAYLRGASVILIKAHTDEHPPAYIPVLEASDVSALHKLIVDQHHKFDSIFMAAAVSDYTPESKLDHKMKKAGNIDLKLIRTPDILSDLGKIKAEGQLLIGFAAETENHDSNAIIKLKNKNLDFIIANDISVSRQDNTEITIISQSGSQKMSGSKFEIAHLILDYIYHGK